ncbi:Ophiobolin F synthase [Metarhizium anisopliae]|nr:Ophiobolin F synthase [Metarhizium anisopliae]
MVDMKTGGLFRMLARMMIAESATRARISDSDMNLFSCLIGRFFQTRDDYQNLASGEYAHAKGFAEDLDEDKYSFTPIHCIQTLPSDYMYILRRDLIQLEAVLMKTRVGGMLSLGARREILAIMNKANSIDYTLDVL